MDAIAEIVEPLGLEFIGAPAQGRRKYRGSVEVEGSTRVIELECDDDGRNASAWRLDVGGDADEAGDETDVATAAPAARGGRTALRIEEILVGLKWSPIHGHIRWRRMPIEPSSCDEPVDQTAALLALEVNDAAVVGLENDLTVVVEGVPDDEGRFYKVEHRSTHDGKHAMVLCLETPFEAECQACRSGLQATGVIDLEGKGLPLAAPTSPREVTKSGLTLSQTLQRVRVWVNDYSRCVDE